MGYRLVGHVVSNRYDWSKLYELGNDYVWKVFIDTKTRLYIISVSKHWSSRYIPFYDFVGGFAVSTDVAEKIPEFERLNKWLWKNKFGCQSIHGELEICLKLSRILSTKVFSFISDDDEDDMASICDKGHVIRLRENRRLLDVLYKDGTLSVIPLIYEELVGLDEYCIDEDLRRLKSDFKGLEILQPVKVEPLLHRIAYTECKKLYPELINTIGLGSFDCGFHIEMISNVETVIFGNGKLELVCSSDIE